MVTVYTPPVRRRNHGTGHSYVDANTLKVPNVTGSIRDGMPKPQLIDWAARTVAETALDRWDELADMKPSERFAELRYAHNKRRNAAALRGTKVHKLAEQYMAGEEVDLTDPDVRAHVESYVAFVDDWNPAPLLVESTVVSYRYGYAGTLDLVADLADGRRWLLDIKTSSAVYGDTALQLAAYRYADRYADDDGEHDMPAVDACGVIHVRADGYDLVPMTVGEAQLTAFRYVAQVAEIVAGLRELKHDALTPPTETENTHV